MKRFFAFLFFLLFSLSVQAQNGHLPYVETFSTARSEGILERVDSLYKSAVNIADSTKGVFKSAKEQDDLIKAYTNFLQELGNYLSDHNYKWERPTKCKNRIYFNKDGAVDYYLFDFKTEISNEKLSQFKELFIAFAATHKISITASVGFAQCSPVTFMDK